jgi:hypothetical protein
MSQYEKRFQELEQETSKSSTDIIDSEATPEKVYEEIIKEDIKSTVKSALHQTYDSDSDVTQEEEKESIEEEKKEVPVLAEKLPVENKAKPPLPKQIIVPDPTFLNDLKNMGFSTEESTAALIEVKNESIELAVDKVFDLKKKMEDNQEASFQSIIASSLGTIPEQEEENYNELKQKENKDKQNAKENQLEKDKKELDQVSQNIAKTQTEINRMDLEMSQLTNAKIYGFSMSTCFDNSQSQIVVSALMEIDEKVVLNVKTLSYHEKYIKKLIEQNDKNNEICLLDNHEIVHDKDTEDSAYLKAVDHLLSHSRFSANTLIPLFMGYQTKNNWSIERNHGPAHIFAETSNKQVQINQLDQIYGTIKLKDYYGKHGNSIIGIYGIKEKPMIIPVEVSDSTVSVSLFL